jgi:hypothetical protein
MARRGAEPFIDAKAIAVRCCVERSPFLGRLREGEPAVGTHGRVEFRFAAPKSMLADAHKPGEVARRPAPGPPAVQGEQRRLRIVWRCGLVLLARRPQPARGRRPGKQLHCAGGRCGTPAGETRSGASAPEVRSIVSGGRRAAGQSTPMALVLTRDQTALLAGLAFRALSEGPITALISALCSARISAQRTVCPLRNLGAFWSRNRCSYSAPETRCKPGATRARLPMAIGAQTDLRRRPDAWPISLPLKVIPDRLARDRAG